VAKGKQKIFFWAELAWTIVNIGFSWICVKSFGLNGAGMAFFGSYIFHWLLIYPIVRRLSGFRWTAANRRLYLLFLSLIGVVFCGFYVLPFFLAVGIGILAVILSGVYTIRVLLSLTSPDLIPRPLQRLLVLFGVARSGSR
jgi:PST family polysaccharide transporter